MITYEEYLKYVDTLKGMARYPYTAKVENPPDANNEYRRIWTREEFDAYTENLRMLTTRRGPSMPDQFKEIAKPDAMTSELIAKWESLHK